MPAQRLAERVLAAAVAALGATVLVQAGSIAGEGGFSGVGPRAFPIAVGALLIVLAAWLARESFSGGFRRVEAPRAGAGQWRNFAVIVGGLIVHLAAIAVLGYIVVSAGLFAACAFGFGSRRPVRDLAIGLALAVATWLVFAGALSIRLPAGPAGWLLS